jgi:hypothetical protein
LKYALEKEGQAFDPPVLLYFCDSGNRDVEPPAPSSDYFAVPKVNVVVDLKVVPGRSSVLGKLGWLGESG